MNDQTQDQSPMPTPAQFGWSRDAVTLAQLLMAGHDDPAADLVVSLMQEPEALPTVLRGMAGMLSEALDLSGTEPHMFFAAVRELLDAGEAEAEQRRSGEPS